MTAKAALCKAFLHGEILNVKNGMDIVGYSNIPREASRGIEKPFGVKLTRTHRTGKSRYGESVYWFDYSLKKTPENKKGIEKMKEYIQSNKKK